MESNPDIKRGIDFENRLGEQSTAIDTAFGWWKGEKFNKRTATFLLVVFIVNFVSIFPVIGKNFEGSFTGSQVLEGIASLFGFLFISKSIFFSVISIFALCIMPLCYYLFVRRVVMRHELTAFLATLVFIIPNPFFYNVPIFVNALLNGDGAHMLVFSFLPLFLLYVQAFIRTGVPILAAMTAIGTAAIAIVSPFAALNLIVIYVVLTVAEGFMGNLRIKIFRLLFLLVAGVLLSFFWYYPSLMKNIILLDNVKYAIDRFFSIAPLAIPVIPVAGALSFLIFDGRERLKPIFIGMSLFISYLGLFAISNNLNMSGIFTAERYLIELAFASSLFLSILFVLLSELVLRNVFPKLQEKNVSKLPLVLKVVGGCLILLFGSRGFYIVASYAEKEIVTNKYIVGVGQVKRVVDFTDITAIIAGVISAVTLISLFYILTKYPSLYKKRGGGKVMPS